MSKTAIITIQNETLCKISGLDLDTRKKLVKMFSYEKPGARFLPAVRLGRWDGKISYFSLGGSTYVNLLDRIIPVLMDDRYEIDLVDNRVAHELTFNKVTEESFSDIHWPKGHVREGQPVILRDYQVKVINAFLENPQSIVSSPTGSGKTILAMALSKSVEHMGRSLVIVPNKTLVTQTEADYINCGLDVGVYFGPRKDYGKQHTICTWQSLNSLLKKEKDPDATEPDLGEFFFDGIICVIVDEVHGASSEVMQKLLNGVLGDVPIRWGLTGTIPKLEMDQMALLTSIGPVTSHLAASELQDKGILAKCHVNIVQYKDKIEFSNYQSELKYLLEDTNRLDSIAELMLKVSETGNTLILVDRINAGKALQTRIPGAVFVSGDTNTNTRQEEYDEIATATNKVIIATYQVAAVGINIPRIFNLVMIEPGKSFVRVIQSIGRGVRKAEDKDEVMIWDITSTCKFSKRHLTARKAFYKEANYPFTLEKHDF